MKRPFSLTVLITIVVIFLIDLHSSGSIETPNSDYTFSKIDTISKEQGAFYLNRYARCNAPEDLELYLRLEVFQIDSTQDFYVKIYDLGDRDSSEATLLSLNECYHQIPLKRIVFRAVRIQNKKVYVAETHSYRLGEEMEGLLDQAMRTW